MSNEKHIFNLYNAKNSIFFVIGLSMIILFVVIYIVSAIIGHGAGYVGSFYGNISGNIGQTVLTALHTALLGLGILFILIASYNLSPKIKCYKDRLEVSHLFHNGNVIPFSDISAVETKVVVHHSMRPWKKDDKEVRVILRNPIYSFQFAYRTKGYFDDIVMDPANAAAVRKIPVSRQTLINIIEQIQTVKNIRMPYLPEEYK